MSKAKIILVNIIIWSIAAIFIFFRGDLSTLYYRLKNGTEIKIGGEAYRLSNSSFLIGKTNSDNFAIGFNGANIVSIMLKSDASVEEFNSLYNTFPSVFNEHKNGSCIFLEKVRVDDNLPELVWYNSSNDFYFTTSDKSIDKNVYSHLRV